MPAIKLLIIVTIAYCLPATHGIMFHLPPNQRKCLREELRQNVLITGDYEVSEHSDQRVNYVVNWYPNYLLYYQYFF